MHILFLGCGSDNLINLTPRNTITLTTPNYPYASLNSYSCCWVIRVEPSSTVMFMIDAFDLVAGFDALIVSIDKFN